MVCEVLWVTFHNLSLLDFNESFKLQDTPLYMAINCIEAFRTVETEKSAMWENPFPTLLFYCCTNRGFEHSNSSCAANHWEWGTNSCFPPSLFYLISLAPRELVDGLAAQWTGRRSPSKSMLTTLIRGIVQDVLNHLIIVQIYESTWNKQHYWCAAVYIVWTKLNIHIDS